MIFFNKWKKRAYEVLDYCEELEKENAALKSDLLGFNDQFLKLCELDMVKRIIELRQSFAGKNHIYPTRLYVPVNVWDEIRSKIDRVHVGDLYFFMGMKVKVTVGELRLS